MCTPESHCFVYEATVTNMTVEHGIPIGHRCLCGRLRFGTAAELRALDETARLEAWLAVPWREGA